MGKGLRKTWKRPRNGIDDLSSPSKLKMRGVLFPLSVKDFMAESPIMGLLIF
jgi:hypothetical protein